jgi:hypothetical protein
MTKEELKDMVAVMTKKLRVKLMPKSTPVSKFVEKLTSKNPRMTARQRKAAILRGC